MSKTVLFFVAAATTLLCLQGPTARAETPASAPIIKNNGAQPVPDNGEMAPLARFIQSVLQDSPKARALAASLSASSARFDAADRPLYNPELELDGENTDVNTRSIGINQSIDWAGKRRARSKAADFRFQVAQAQTTLARQALAADLLKALAEYGAANELNRLGRQRIKLMRQFAHIAEKRQAAGDLDQVEFDLAKLAALQAELEAAELTTRLNDAQRTLLALTGTQRNAWPTLPVSPPQVSLDHAAKARLLASHPATVANRARVAAARSTIALRKKQAKPDPTVNLRAGREGDSRLAGLSLSIPLFVRNRFKAEVAEADALLTQAQQDARASGLDLQAGFDAALQRYQLTRAAWMNWRKSGAASLQRRASLLKRLWQTGELSTTDYLVQLKQTLDTQGAATELHSRLWQAWADWQQASGTILQGLARIFHEDAQQTR